LWAEEEEDDDEHDEAAAAADDMEASAMPSSMADSWSRVYTQQYVDGAL
jgi:hypothetical protein